MRIPLLMLVTVAVGCDDPTTEMTGPTGTVSLTVRHGMPGMPVIFVAADDTVVTSTTTDANGHAEAEMQAGGSINLYLENDLKNGSGLIYTFAGVELGDAYVFELGDRSWNPIDTVITVPEFPGATQYAVSSPCGDNSGPTPTVAAQLGNCGATTDFYVYATSSSQLLAAFLVQNVPVGPSISLASATYVTPSPVTLSIAGVPTGVDALVAAVVLVGTWNIGSYDCGAVRFNCQIDVPIVPGAELGLQFEAVKNAAYQAFTGRAAFLDGAIVGDVGANLMPWITGPGVADDAADVTWPQDATGMVPVDGVVVQTYSSIPATPNPIHFDRFTSSRHGASARVHVPRLPAPFEDFNVNANTLVGQVFTLGFGEDYEAHRLVIFGGRAVDRTLFEQFPTGKYVHVGGHN